MHIISGKHLYLGWKKELLMHCYFLVYFHIGVYIYATFATGIATLPAILLFILFVAITTVLYILMKIIIGYPAFKSCRELII